MTKASDVYRAKYASQYGRKVRRSVNGSYNRDVPEWNSKFCKQRAGRTDLHTCTNFQRDLSVQTTVEYDLPCHIYPPKNAGHILTYYYSNMKRNQISPPRTVFSSNFLGCSSTSSRPSFSVSNNNNSVMKGTIFKMHNSPRSSRYDWAQIPLIDLA